MKKSSIFVITAVAVIAAGVASFVFLRKDEDTTTLFGGMHAAPVESLSATKPTESVELKDSDTYNLKAGLVRKKIGNKEYRMLAYNGSIPGPLIKVKQGSEVTINFTNNTDVDSTIHSHGVRMDNAFDGVPEVTQDPVKPGASFTYQLKFPDTGVYWYHPHVREDYAQELGLYGNFLVEPDDPGYWNQVNREEMIMLDDILIENGVIARFDPEIADHTLMGRFGNVMLVNGETNYRIDAKRGDAVRFYFTNAANTRTFNVVIASDPAIAGARGNLAGIASPPEADRNDGMMKMKLVGGDNGKYEREAFVENVILGPSERAIVEVLFDTPGTYRLAHRTPENSYPLAAIAVSPERASPSYAPAYTETRAHQEVTASINALQGYFDTPADKSLRMAIVMKSPKGTMNSGGGQHMMHGGQVMENQMMQMGESKPIEWEDDMGVMNRDSTTETLTWQLVDEQTGKANMKIDDWKFKVGDKAKIKIFNDPKTMHPMQHPIHIHGQRFLALSTNGVKSDNLVWKDTALIKTGDTVELLVEMANPGTWMIHCHIAEHLEAGMMMKFQVI